jgi:hypothetical protein
MARSFKALFAKGNGMEVFFYFFALNSIKKNTPKKDRKFSPIMYNSCPNLAHNGSLNIAKILPKIHSSFVEN